MSTIQTKTYFIVSLPRTGTKSLCKMTEILGFSFKHVPSNNLPRCLNLNSYDVYADTPVFRPSVFRDLVKDEKNMFIYINRPPYEWVDSFERVSLDKNYMRAKAKTMVENQVMQLDRETLEEIFNHQDYTTEIAIRSYYQHRDAVVSTIPKDRLLVYKFSMGWGPLCEFMQVPVPGVDIPHINKNTMFDKI